MNKENKTPQTTEPAIAVEPVLVAGLSIDEFIKKETETREIEFWGQKHTITPALVSELHGDGLQVVWLSSIDTRPFYWVLRIDSSVDIENDESLSKEDQSNYGSIEELLVQMTEEEYGNIDRYKENDEGKYFDTYDDSVEPFEYDTPMMSWGGGSWGLLANFKTGEAGS